jgi:hypothetical protein
MATFTFFDEIKRYMGERVTAPTTSPSFAADAHIMYLSNDAPVVATDTVKADVVNITEQNGYTATALTESWAETAGGSGIWRFANNADVSWTASGGSFGPFQYVVIYNDTTTTPADLLVGYWDVGSATTITTGNTFTVDLDANFAIFTLDG